MYVCTDMGPLFFKHVKRPSCLFVISPGWTTTVRQHFTVVYYFEVEIQCNKRKLRCSVVSTSWKAFLSKHQWCWQQSCLCFYRWLNFTPECYLRLMRQIAIAKQLRNLKRALVALLVCLQTSSSVVVHKGMSLIEKLKKGNLCLT